MKITLRKAKALQTSIYEVIQGLSLNPYVTIMEFDDAEKVLKEANDKFLTAINTRDSLWAAYYTIRDLVAVANQNFGISKKLNEKALIEKRISDLALTQGDSYLQRNLNIIKSQQEKLTKIPVRESYAHQSFESISTGIFTADQQSQTKMNLASLKKQRQIIDDELLEINVRNQIDLDDNTVNVLKSINIL